MALSRHAALDVGSVDIDHYLVVQEGSAQTPIASHDLYRRFVSGDERSLAILISMYKEELTRSIMGIVKNAQDADELLNECFVKLGLSGARFKNPYMLKTYLFTIGKNLALNRLKQNKRRNEASCPLDEFLVSEDKDLSPEALTILDERKEQLLAAMSGLKKSHRDALCYVYFDNLSYQGAAREMGKSPSQVADIIYRAKASLRKRLESEGFIYVDE